MREGRSQRQTSSVCGDRTVLPQKSIGLSAAAAVCVARESEL